jgi:uncharacterized glyoxalase superfamily protein PhnB
MPGEPANECSLFLYTEDANAAFKRATSAGGEVTMPLEEQFWGDLLGVVEDRWGHRWNIAQHVKDLSDAEMKKAIEDCAAKMAKNR